MLERTGAIENLSASSVKEWKSGWPLVLASSFGMSFFGMMLAAIGLFMAPLSDEFGWSRAMLSSGHTIASLCTAVLGPFLGLLVDRYGARRLALPGLLLTIASISAFSLLDGQAVYWYVLWATFGIVTVGIKTTTWTAAIVGVFTRSRGLALGLTMSGTALAAIVVPPLGNYLIATAGWRAAFVWLALGWGGLTFALCFLFFFDAHDRVRQRAKAGSKHVEQKIDLPGLTVAQGLRNTALWRIAFSNFVIMTLTIGLSVHLFPILTEAGISRTKAAWLLSLAGIAGVAGKLATGMLLDRFRPNWIGGMTLGAAALAFALLIDGVRSPPLIIFAMLVNGYAFGTKTQITGYMTASYAGMKNFGFLYSIMSTLLAIASGIGPFVAGLIYDYAGGYDPFLIAGTFGCALSGVLIASLPQAPDWTAEPADRVR
jgi:predicted MFS family arabinose efflux permease